MIIPDIMQIRKELKSAIKTAKKKNESQILVTNYMKVLPHEKVHKNVRI